jgi:serine/threonine protein kinase
MIGKGGSSRVYRVMSDKNEIYAIKRVSLDKTDEETMKGYMNEIALLKRLDGNSRIIRLIDSELKVGPGSSKGHLLLLMECGEIGSAYPSCPHQALLMCTGIDLARLLQEQQREAMNMVWISYYWQQVYIILILNTQRVQLIRMNVDARSSTHNPRRKNRSFGPEAGKFCPRAGSIETDRFWDCQCYCQ